MNSDDERIVSDLVAELEKAWNAADGARFGRPFAEDADFVNIRGEHLRTREVIAKGRQAIFEDDLRGQRRPLPGHADAELIIALADPWTTHARSRGPPAVSARARGRS